MHATNTGGLKSQCTSEREKKNQDAKCYRDVKCSKDYRQTKGENLLTHAEW